LFQRVRRSRVGRTMRSCVDRSKPERSTQGEGPRAQPSVLVGRTHTRVCSANQSRRSAINNSKMITRPDKLPISVIVPIKNEERNIAACLESVEWADEIWVVDSHSSDGALAIARRYTDKIAQFDYSGGFPKKKNWALQNLPLKHEWVLLLDADERVTPQF